MLSLVAGQTIVNLLDDAEANKLVNCLPEYISTLDASGCVISPGTDTCTFVSRQSSQTADCMTLHVMATCQLAVRY